MCGVVMWVLTKDLIKESEERCVQSGTFSFKELMLRAGNAAAKAIENKYNVLGKRIAVFCGKGNNGGDGCVIAARLAESGALVTVVTPFGEPVTENAAFYCEQLNAIDKINAVQGEYDIIIDALFGIGYKAENNPEVNGIFDFINSSPALKISVDLPSGVECDTGKIAGTAVKADFTVTFIAHKPCFMLPPANEFCGEVTVADIGVKPIGKAYEIIQKPEFPERRHNSHKGTYGTALLICGSYGMAGALMLSAKAALRSGLGIVKCLLPESIYSAFTSHLPEAVCVIGQNGENGTLKYNPELLQGETEKCGAILIGCGSGKSNDVDKAVEHLIKKSEKPIVIDADGINSLAKRIDILLRHKAPIILTPHSGEMARLLNVSAGDIEENRLFYAKSFAEKYKCTLVLKGANTVVATENGDIYFNTLGNSGMATGGSGDVLAGVIVSLLAQGYDAVNAAKYGVYLHSLAGDKAAEKRSRHALLPSDIIEEL